MTVKAQILDMRLEDGNKCFLSKLSLGDYVSALDSTYQEYDVQREIVSNVYLDHLVDTVLGKRHIPPIVLIADSHNLKETGGFLEIEKFKILDGLQRTFRLQAIKKTIDFCIEDLDLNTRYLEWTKFRFSKEFSRKLNEFNSNTSVLRSVLEFSQKNGKDTLKRCLTDNSQWFEIWTGLNPEQEVQKMLTLNAGHKPVKPRHQLELLFLNLLPILKNHEDAEFKIFREKEVSATMFSKNREVGQFHFAHIITALLSLYAGKPISTNTNLIQNIQSNESEKEIYLGSVNSDSIRKTISFLLDLDGLLKSQYGEDGVMWMGREVTLAGLFAALGCVSIEKNSAMDKLLDICNENPSIFQLESFEKVRNSVDLSKVNIGTVNRKAVFSAIKELLSSYPVKNIEWKKHFGNDD